MISMSVEMERVKGIEPSYSAWKAAALPLSYTRVRHDLSCRADGLNRGDAVRAGLSFPEFGPKKTAVPATCGRRGALTRAGAVPIMMSPSTTKGGDPVSLTKRCHLAGIARCARLSLAMGGSQSR